MAEKVSSQMFPLLPLRGTLVFPYMVTPLEIGRRRSIEAIEQALVGDGRIVLAAQHHVHTEEPLPEEIYRVGTLCEIKQLLKVPEGQVRILVEGLSRVTLEHIDDADGYYEAFVTIVPELDGEMQTPGTGSPGAHRQGRVWQICAAGQEGSRPKFWCR